MRMEAVKALSELGDSRAVEPLGIALKNEDDRALTHALIDALRTIGDSRGIDPLLTKVDDSDEEIQEAAAQALLTLGETAVERLVAKFENKDDEVPLRVAYALAKTRDPRAISLIVTKLEYDSSLFSVLKAAGDGAVEPLITALRHEHVLLRHRALTALGDFGDSRAVEALAGALKDDSREVRMKAAFSLARLKDARAVETLVTVIEDKTLESNARSSAAFHLGGIGNGRAVECLIVALKDEDSDVRKNAAWSLRELGDPRAVEPLILALKDENGKVRENAAWGLNKLGDARAIEPLILVLKHDQVWDVRERAAWALADIGDSRAIDPLVQLVFYSTGTKKLFEAATSAAHILAGRIQSPVDRQRHAQKIALGILTFDPDSPRVRFVEGKYGLGFEVRWLKNENLHVTISKEQENLTIIRHPGICSSSATIPTNLDVKQVFQGGGDPVKPYDSPDFERRLLSGEHRSDMSRNDYLLMYWTQLLLVHPCAELVMDTLKYSKSLATADVMTDLAALLICGIEDVQNEVAAAILRHDDWLWFVFNVLGSKGHPSSGILALEAVQAAFILKKNCAASQMDSLKSEARRVLGRTI